MVQPLPATYAAVLQRAIADGSLSGAALQAMLAGPSPVGATPSRRQTTELRDAGIPNPR